MISSKWKGWLENCANPQLNPLGSNFGPNTQLSTSIKY